MNPLKLGKNSIPLLHLLVILAMSTAASYTSLRTHTVYQINGIDFYHYLAYASAILFGYFCFSYYNKFIATAFALTLSGIAFSPIGLKTIKLFPLATPLLTVLMGIVTVLVVPSSRGKGFFEFLFTLILPAVLAESRIGGSMRLLLTSESIGYYELSAVTAVVIGGYFYLKYVTLANLICQKLLSNGGDEKDVNEAGLECNLILILMTLGASGIAVALMITAPIFASAFQTLAFLSPFYILILATIAGAVVATALYVFKISYREPLLERC